MQEFRKKYQWILLALLVVVGEFSISKTAFATDLSSQNYQVLTPTITSGGGYATSNNFSLLGVISEFVHTTANSFSFNSNPGFAAFPFVSTPIISATGGNATANLSWTVPTTALGYSVSGYSIGRSSVSGGPYAFTVVGDVLSGTFSNLTNGSTYYFVLHVLGPQGLTIATSSEISVTPTAPPQPPPPSDGGGGGGGGGSFAPTTIPPTVLGATVVFSGQAYPNSTVVLLKDGQIALSMPAGGDARFHFSLTGLSAGSYIFSVYGIDNANNKSLPLSFPETLVQGGTTDINGIFISPTINVDKSEVKHGDTIVISGQSTPRSKIFIKVNSSTELSLQTQSDVAGAYFYNLDTSPLEIGSHLVRSQVATSSEISDFNGGINFIVGTQDIKKMTTMRCGIDDLNCDGKVNLIDFSIMAYWYQRPLSGTGFKADLNHDGKVNLVDFSILASHWTG